MKVLLSLALIGVLAQNNLVLTASDNIKYKATKGTSYIQNDKWEKLNECVHWPHHNFWGCSVHKNNKTEFTTELIANGGGLFSTFIQTKQIRINGNLKVTGAAFDYSSEDLVMELVSSYVTPYGGIYKYEFSYEEDVHDYHPKQGLPWRQHPKAHAILSVSYNSYLGKTSVSLNTKASIGDENVGGATKQKETLVTLNYSSLTFEKYFF